MRRRRRIAHGGGLRCCADAGAPDDRNTGDDFDHFGLRICPDIDTVAYMLSGAVDETRGWGRRDESWNATEIVGQLGGETWFNLGDRNFALHLRRTEMLRQGRTLSQVTADLRSRLGVTHRIAPMSDEPVRMVIRTAGGDHAFQDYFVRQRAEPVRPPSSTPGPKPRRSRRGLSPRCTIRICGRSSLRLRIRF